MDSFKKHFYCTNVVRVAAAAAAAAVAAVTDHGSHRYLLLQVVQAQDNIHTSSTAYTNANVHHKSAIKNRMIVSNKHMFVCMRAHKYIYIYIK